MISHAGAALESGQLREDNTIPIRYAHIQILGPVSCFQIMQDDESGSVWHLQ